MTTGNRFSGLSGGSSNNRFSGLEEEDTKLAYSQDTSPSSIPKSSPAPQTPVQQVADTKPQESFWKKAAKAVLPQSVEDYFGLNGQPADWSAEF
jgi:hypothetical protein